MNTMHLPGSALFGLWLIAAAPTLAQTQSTPCRDWFAAGLGVADEPQDTAMALTEPDCYAWRLFVALNWPANTAQQQADAAKRFGDEGPATWEVWRNARTEAPGSAYPPSGRDPGPWLTPTAMAERVAESFDSEPLQRRLRPSFHVEFDNAAAQGNETRLNKATYEFVRGNDLYNLDGQVALFLSGARKIDFPPMAKEIKAQWRRITPADKSRYHWTEVTMPGGNLLYGLTALHITTKDLPNWFWATFEHIDNKQPQSAGGRSGNEGWQLSSVDRFSCPDRPVDCDRAPDVAPIRGTRWANYVLRGTQIDFIASTGQPTLLANSQPERGFQRTSSCISCHAIASIGSNGSRLDFFFDLPSGDVGGHVGPPNPDWFRASSTGALQFTQLDFVWSLMRAQRKP